MIWQKQLWYFLCLLKLSEAVEHICFFHIEDSRIEADIATEQDICCHILTVLVSQTSLPRSLG